jgi:Leucine-rich repeat (LRR) protein
MQKEGSVQTQVPLWNFLKNLPFVNFHSPKKDILSVVGVGSLPTTLTSLDLSHNRLCSLSLDYLPHLQSLCINHNQITELDNLPPNLSRAHVGYNDVISLNYKILLQKGLTLECEAAFVDRSLERIIACWFASTREHELPKATRASGRELDLSRCALTSVSSLIGLCTHLQVLDLSSNCLVTLPQEVFF